ncbi:MAG: hypothetical protein MI700_12565 [Balneolales bacterium]|nr:hypothetical protein [Balneolales bacterium]
MRRYLFAVASLIVLLNVHSVTAQYGEPALQTIEQPLNLFDEGYKTGVGFSFGLNDFGFGAGVQFRKGLSPYTEGILSFEIAGLRDPSEQTFIDYTFGNRTIASKYQRVIALPLSVGLKRRIFAPYISDNFRLHTSMSLGPTMAVVLPYFDDINGNNYREVFEFITIGEAGGYYTEPVYDIFQGWDQATTEFGWNGEIVFGVDFGENFARLQSFQFGYSFYYFQNGIQIMEPQQPLRDINGLILDANADGLADFYERTNDDVNYFGSAQITFIIGWMW